MKANELQIGDWVQIVEPCKYAGAIGRVKTLIDHKDDENAYFKVFLKNNTIHIGIEDICSDDIRPIPITPEILKKNGFEYFHKNYASLSYEHPFKLEMKQWPDENGAGGLWVICGIIEIRFVHELQHALSLCGIKKEIEL